MTRWLAMVSASLEWFVDLADGRDDLGEIFLLSFT
jgi:hypothetical protein